MSRTNRGRVRRALSGHVTGSSIYGDGPRWYKWTQAVKQSLFYWSVTAVLGESELQSSFDKYQAWQVCDDEYTL